MAGRPKKIFTAEQITQIEEMAFCGCKTETIASATGIKEDTLRRHYAPKMIQKRAEGKIALKKVQHERALAGDSTMLVWLGKNELEQTDKFQADITTKILQVEGIKPLV